MTKKIDLTEPFRKKYKQAIASDKKLPYKYKRAVGLFLEDRNHKDLSDHQLEGKMKLFRAFSVDFNCRVIYIEKEHSYLFVDIGSHEEVYFR
jgi:mRNA-degrading endonuclease YafQ of YafQ-DinJ toxin-antitoxin module